MTLTSPAQTIALEEAIIPFAVTILHVRTKPLPWAGYQCRHNGAAPDTQRRVSLNVQR